MNVFDKILNFEYENNTGIVNITGGFFVLLLKRMFKNSGKSLLVVAPNEYESRKLYNYFDGDNEVILFEDDGLSLTDGISVSPEARVDRINILNEVSSGDKKIVLTDMRGFLKKLPSSKSFDDNCIVFSIGLSISYDELVNKLVNIGYNRCSVVSQMGDFSVRGFVIDIFPVNFESPVRIEFFGDEVDSIRKFDIVTQKSISELDNFKVIPFSEKFSDCNSSLYDYLGDVIVVFKDYEQIKFVYDKMVMESFELGYDVGINYFDIRKFDVDDKLYYFDFDSCLNLDYVSKVVSFDVSSVPLFSEDFRSIDKYISSVVSDGKTVVLCTNMSKINRFLEFVSFSYIITNFDSIYDGKVNVVRDSLSCGFDGFGYVFLTDFELFGRKPVKYKKTRFRNVSRIRDLSKINIGDYVVHNSHGIGIYNGIKVISKNGVVSDYLEVLYAKGDKLYIPASKIELISKYNGKDGYVPHINALNSTSWIKTKQRIREKIRYEAERLIKVQAERQFKKGYAFSADQPLQKLFEEEFMYEATPDQLKAISEIKADMESSVPMDRILCGDVGYGKTEVAFRAMFKAVLDSKQVLYLCPTTLLCNQQYEVALERFKNYPVNIAVLNRFVSISETNKVLNGLFDGSIDIVFCTHRGLSNDVVFSDLGLLVIDEEQRFGVAHKEKIKEIKSSVDVLTLTATPIPRTLQMAVLGIKNMSLIETPPKNRKSVATYVVPFDKKLVREIIYKEVGRGGQVYILYNRVDDIERKLAIFKALAPDVSFGIAHGKMNKDDFEQVMNSFTNGEFDVLICTTIIETGVDIPNVNSLIVLNADRFGLSQLYQIRGRVGRSDRLAYAYLMYEKGKVLTEQAIKRLKVIKDFTELGSGFAIATRDLSIRGAGDILGSEQAGFIDTVGMDMYLKMLNEEVLRLKGEEPVDDVEDDLVNINVCSHVKDSYVSDEDIKIEIHKKINSINSFESLTSVKKEFEDRFGPVDEDLLVYMNEQLFESLVNKVGIIRVFDNNKYREVFFDKSSSEKIDYEELFVKGISINNHFTFSYKNDMLGIRLMYKDSDVHVVFDFIKLLEELV